jgi:hypothetical protein
MDEALFIRGRIADACNIFLQFLDQVHYEKTNFQRHQNVTQ